jgi:hypothetical protein
MDGWLMNLLNVCRQRATLFIPNFCAPPVSTRTSWHYLVSVLQLLAVFMLKHGFSEAFPDCGHDRPNLVPEKHA